MMDVTLLVTNGGPHPADKWAAMAANRIADLIQIDELSDSAIAAQARKAKPRLAIDLADALEPHFTTATQDELGRVNSGAISSRNDPIDADQYIPGGVSLVVNTTSPTMFGPHFSDPGVQSVVGNILKSVFLDALNIERSWAFDAKGL